MDPSDLLSKSLAMVLDDEGFKVPSPSATEALSVATELVTWCQDESRKGQFKLFAQWLVDTLKTCFRVSSKAARLEHYHNLRISKPFKEEWEKFFQTSLCQCALPTVFQFVSHQFFKKFLELELKVAENNGTGAATYPMTWEEENTLHYVTGYVCRKVHSKLAKSSVKDKEEMVLFCV